VILNPVTSDYSVLKPSLLSGLLENVAHNFAHKRKDLRLFEGRRVFAKDPPLRKRIPASPPA